MSLLGYTWPPIDTYKERLEMFQNEALRAQEVLSNERQVEATAESLGYGMTAYERAVHDRAQEIAAAERRELETSSTEQRAAEVAAAAPSAEDMDDSVEAVNVSDDEGKSTPHAKRQKSYTSPMKVRSPLALEEAILESNGEVQRMMDIESELPQDTILHSSPEADDLNLKPSLPEEIQASKDRIFIADFMQGGPAGVEVKKEEIDRLQGLDPQPKVWKSVPQGTVDLTTPQPESVATAPKPKPKAQPEMTREEMEMLYLTVRRKQLLWKADEDGHFHILEMDDDKPPRLDATVPKGTGKSCQGALGVKHASGVLKLCARVDGELQYVDGADGIPLFAPCVFHNSKMDSLVSMQSLSRDYVPSKKDFSVTAYVDSKVVKFDKARNRAPKEWLACDTKATPHILSACEDVGL